MNPAPPDLERYRLYLLHIARGELRTDLQAKVGGSDLVQETFLAALETLQRQAPPASLQDWLRGILDNQLVDVYRRYIRTRKRCVHGEQPLGDLASAGREPSVDDNPGSATITDELARQLAAAFDGLTMHERAVFEYRVSDALRWEAIAERLDTSAGAARKTFARTLPKLRRLLPDLDPGRDP